MRFFWPIYILSAMVGTTAVYLIAPVARPFIPEFLKMNGPGPQGQGRSAQSAPERSAASAQAVPAARTDQPAGADVPYKPVEIATVEELPPALNGIYLAQRGEKPGWGITHQRTVYYTLVGSRAGEVDGGVILEFRGTRTSSKGGMIECVLYENGRPSAPLLVSAGEVFLFTGHFDKLSDRQRADLQAYYVLSGKIAQRKRELLQVSAEKNPFFVSYQAAYKTLMTHVGQGKELTVKRERATELERMRIEDQLREMKMKEGQLRAAYDAEHLKFRTWKQQHANELAKPEEDSLVKQWMQQKAEIIPRIPGLAY